VGGGAVVVAGPCAAVNGVARWRHWQGRWWASNRRQLQAKKPPPVAAGSGGGSVRTAAPR